jgi:hypothetical protein
MTENAPAPKQGGFASFDDGGRETAVARRWGRWIYRHNPTGKYNRIGLYDRMGRN